MSLADKKMTRTPSDPPMFGMRGGETALAFDPAQMDGDARIVFIGRVRSPWTTRQDCPKNVREARERGDARGATVEIDAPYRAGLMGIASASHVILLTWLDFAPRNLIVQKPRHATEAKGVFALRSPARPNPVGLHTVRLLGLDATAGLLSIDAIDVLDGTPLIDMKPHFASVDAVPDATIPRGG
jgi:tRNA-Thr(GGU) m(6)t(6)A37 methyltransferase TsaA